MKIAILGDPHFGIKDGSVSVFEYQLSFFEEVLKPVIKDQNIDSIMFLGDICHNRHSLNSRIIYKVQQLFNSIDCNKIVLFGNHDLFYKNSYEISSPNLFLKNVNDTILVDGESEYAKLPGKCLCTNWLNSRAEYIDFFKSIDEKRRNQIEYLFGHFELYQFKVTQWQQNNDGNSLTTSDIEHYFPSIKKVFSGHYHNPQSNGIVDYVGVPYQQTWGEYGERLGFKVLDLDNDEVTFVLNNKNMFYFVEITSEKQKVVLPESKFPYQIKLKYSKPELQLATEIIADELGKKGHSVLVVNTLIRNIVSGESKHKIYSMEEYIDEYFDNRVQVDENQKNKLYNRFLNLFNECRGEIKNNEML